MEEEYIIFARSDWDSVLSFWKEQYGCNDGVNEPFDVLQDLGKLGRALSWPLAKETPDDYAQRLWDAYEWVLGMSCGGECDKDCDHYEAMGRTLAEVGEEGMPPAPDDPRLLRWAYGT